MKTQRHIAPGGRAAALSGALAALAVLALLAGCSGADERKQAHRERAEAYLAATDYDKARIEYKNVLKIDPGDVAARMGLGRVQERLQNWRQAAGQYLRVIEDDAANQEARLRMGKIYLLAKQREKAVELAEQVLALNPDSAPALALRGNARVGLGDLAGARADAAAALAADPSDFASVSLAATLAAQRGEYPRAIALLEGAVSLAPDQVMPRVLLAEIEARSGDTEGAVAALEALVEAFPDRFAHRLRLIRYYERLGRQEDAERALKAAVAHAPADPAPKLAYAQHVARYRSWKEAAELLSADVRSAGEPLVFQKALSTLYRAAGQAEDVKRVERDIIAARGLEPPGLEARTRLAEVLAREGKTAEAQKLIAEVLAENAADQAALTLRATIGLGKRDALGAIADLRTILRDHPDDPKTLWLLARAHLLDGDVDLAKDHYQRALAAQPALALARIELAQVLVRGKDVDGAKKLLGEGLTATPRSLPLLTVLARLDVATRDWARASDIASRFKEAYPKRATGHYLAGLVAQSKRDFTNAAAELEQATELAPENATALAALAGSLIAGERAGEALATLGAAAERQPGNATIGRLRGRVLRLLKRYDEAETVFKRVIALDDKNPSSYRELALNHLAQRNTAAARAVLERGLTATGGSLLLTTDLAQLDDALGDPDAAIALYDAYLARDPDSEPAANNLAMMLALRRTDPASLDRAARLAERFRESKVPGYLDTLAWVHHKRGENAAAISILEDVVTLSPNQPAFLYHLGAALAASGKRQRGVEQIQKALALKRPFAEQRDAVAVLEKLAGGSGG